MCERDPVEASVWVSVAKITFINIRGTIVLRGVWVILGKLGGFIKKLSSFVMMA